MTAESDTQIMPHHPKVSLCHHTVLPFMTQIPTCSLSSFAMAVGPHTRIATRSWDPVLEGAVDDLLKVRTLPIVL